MKPIIKFNNGKMATLCHNCKVIINESISNKLYCDKCIEEFKLKEKIK